MYSWHKGCLRGRTLCGTLVTLSIYTVYGSVELATVERFAFLARFLQLRLLKGYQRLRLYNTSV